MTEITVITLVVDMVIFDNDIIDLAANRADASGISLLVFQLPPAKPAVRIRFIVVDTNTGHTGGVPSGHCNAASPIAVADVIPDLEAVCAYICMSINMDAVLGCVGENAPLNDTVIIGISIDIRLKSTAYPQVFHGPVV